MIRNIANRPDVRRHGRWVTPIAGAAIVLLCGGSGGGFNCDSSPPAPATKSGDCLEYTLSGDQVRPTRYPVGAAIVHWAGIEDYEYSGESEAQGVIEGSREEGYELLVPNSGLVANIKAGNVYPLPDFGQLSSRAAGSIAVSVQTPLTGELGLSRACVREANHDGIPTAIIGLPTAQG